MESAPEQPRPYQSHQETYEHGKNIKKGSERLDRRSAAGVRGQPKKSGRGGKYTWDGSTPDEDNSSEVALDEKDPNYVDEEQEVKGSGNIAENAVEAEKSSSVEGDAKQVITN